MIKRKQTLQNEKGVAMVFVLCAMLVFIVLSISVLLAASIVQGNAIKGVAGERLKICALSFSEMLEQELVNEKRMDENDLKEFIRQMILEKGAEGVFEAENPGEVPTLVELTCQINGENTADYLKGYDIEINMYWEGKRNEIAKKLVEAQGNGGKAEQAYDDIKVYLDVICVKEEESYRIRSEYTVAISQSEGSEEQEWRFQLGGKY